MYKNENNYETLVTNAVAKLGSENSAKLKYVSMHLTDASDRKSRVQPKMICQN